MKRRNTLSLFAIALCALMSLVMALGAEGPPGRKQSLNVSMPDLRMALLDGKPFLASIETVKFSKDWNVEIIHFQDPPPTRTWTAAYMYRVTGEPEDRASAGVLTQITPLTNVLGKYTLSLDGYGGFTLRNAAPVLATVIGATFKAADQVTISLHGGIQYTVGEVFTLPNGIVVGIGIGVKF